MFQKRKLKYNNRKSFKLNLIKKLMDCFIKKIFDGKNDEFVHLQFQKFSRGEFTDRAMVKVKESGETGKVISIDGSSGRYTILLDSGKTADHQINDLADLDEALSIPTVDKLNPTIVSNMMAEIPSVHARWNYFYNEAAYEYDMMKTKLEVWTAKKSQEYRKQLAQDGKVTEKMIDEMVKSDPQFEQLNDDLALSKKNMKHVLAQANGFGDKGEKLINIASLIKWEGENLSGGKGASSRQYPHVRKKNEYVMDVNQNEGWPTKTEEN